jgi:hypothetical protein
VRLWQNVATCANERTIGGYLLLRILWLLMLFFIIAVPSWSQVENALLQQTLQRLQRQYQSSFRMNIIMEIQQQEGPLLTNVRMEGISQRKDARHLRIALEAEVFSQQKMQHGSSSITKKLQLLMVKDGTHLWCDFVTDGMQQVNVMRMELDQLQKIFADRKQEIPMIFQSPVVNPDLLLKTMSATMQLKISDEGQGLVKIWGDLSAEAIAMLDVSHLKKPRLEMYVEPNFPVAYRIFDGDQAVILLHHSNMEQIKPEQFEADLFKFELEPDRQIRDIGLNPKAESTQ